VLVFRGKKYSTTGDVQLVIILEYINIVKLKYGDVPFFFFWKGRIAEKKAHENAPFWPVLVLLD